MRKYEGRGQLTPMEPSDLAESLRRHEAEFATVLWGPEDGFYFYLVVIYFIEHWGTVAVFETETEAISYLNDGNDSGAIYSGDSAVGEMEFTVEGLRELPAEANENASEI